VTVNNSRVKSLIVWPIGNQKTVIQSSCPLYSLVRSNDQRVKNLVSTRPPQIEQARVCRSAPRCRTLSSLIPVLPRFFQEASPHCPPSSFDQLWYLGPAGLTDRGLRAAQLRIAAIETIVHEHQRVANPVPSASRFTGNLEM